MPSKLRVRFIFRPLVKLIAKGLSKVGVTPNVATVIMFAFSILSFFSLIFLNHLLLFAMLILITGIFDGVDGAIARLTNKTTIFGGFFDSVMDRFSEMVIFLALLIYMWNQYLWNILDMKLIIFISFFATIMISYSRARAENFFKEGDYDVGLLGRSEKLFYLFVTMAIAFFLGFTKEFLFLYMWLVLGTFAFRFFLIKRQIKTKESNEKKK